MPKYLLIVLLLSCAFLLSGCANESGKSDAKLHVVASFYPMYDFVKNVGGDRVNVTLLIPAGVEPHDYEPSPSAIRELNNAHVFVYNGAGLEPWAPELIAGCDNDLLMPVAASSSIPLLPSSHADDASEKKSGTEQSTDPHVWLDPVLAKKQVITIRDSLITADPSGRDYYTANANAYLSRLDSLDNAFRTMFLSCKKKDILISHATLAYFCNEYGCTQVPITGTNPESEPSPADLVSVISLAREHNITSVYYEKMLNPKSAGLISSELGGQALVFNSVHGLTADEQAQGKDYISLMHDNLAQLRAGLDCD